MMDDGGLVGQTGCMGKEVFLSLYVLFVPFLWLVIALDGAMYVTENLFFVSTSSPCKVTTNLILVPHTHTSYISPTNNKQ
jgi:hypothetical protein